MQDYEILRLIDNAMDGFGGNDTKILNEIRRILKLYQENTLHEDKISVTPNQPNPRYQNFCSFNYPNIDLGDPSKWEENIRKHNERFEEMSLPLKK